MVKMYKGFNKDMTCNGYQYEEGKEYTCDDARLCECGFHACEMPLDCFKYYKPDKSVYREVELDDIDERKSDDSKRCGKRIKIGAKVDIAGLIKAQVDIVRDSTNAGGDCSINAGGNGSTNAGGDWSTNAGGDWSTNAGGDGSTNAGGNWSTNAGGYRSTNAGGDRSTNAGGDGSTNAGGENSLCICWNGKCKGGVGSLLVIGHGYFNGDKWVVDGYAHGVVDGEKIKADTWYEYRNGELVEVTEDE